VAELRGCTTSQQLRLSEGVGLWPLLPTVAVGLPQLHRLELRVPLAKVDQRAIGLPSQLRSLHLTVCVSAATPLSSGDGAALLRLAEQFVAAAPPSLNSLRLSIQQQPFSYFLLPSAVLAFLARIPTLTELAVDAPWEDAAVRAAFRGMRQLRTLHRVGVGFEPHLVNRFAGWDAASLAQLTEGQIGVDYPPLESLGWMTTVDEAMLPSLLRLPTLTELQSSSIDLRDVGSLLAGLPQLRSFHAVPGEVDQPAWWAALAQALPLCPQLTELTVSDDSKLLTDEHLVAILRAVPQLQSLTLGVTGLGSLRCFAETPHLADTLQLLHLTDACGSIDPSELLHLRLLRALRELAVECLSAAPSAEFEAQLRPDEARRYWPSIQHVELDTRR